MIVGIRIEVLPRYSSPIGNIWISQMDEEGRGNEEVVGSIQLRNKEEQALWETTVSEMHEKIQKELFLLSQRQKL